MIIGSDLVQMLFTWVGIVVQLWCSFVVCGMSLYASVVIHSWFCFVWTGSVLGFGSYLVQWWLSIGSALCGLVQLWFSFGSAVVQCGSVVVEHIVSVIAQLWEE